MTHRWRIGTVLGGVLLAAVLTAVAGAEKTGRINGLVGLVGPGGRFYPGGQVSLLLVNRPLAVPSTDGVARMTGDARAEALNRAHMAFFITLRQALGQPGFRQADAVSSRRGTFDFSAVPPGRFWVVVSFPALIHGEKTAWQVPVRVRAGKSTLVSLDNRNHLFPLLCADCPAAEYGHGH
jgi:hypothetical protein